MFYITFVVASSRQLKRSSINDYSTFGTEFYVGGMRNANVSTDFLVSLISTKSTDEISYLVATSNGGTDTTPRTAAFDARGILGFNVDDFIALDETYAYRHSGVKIFTVGPLISVVMFNLADASFGSYLAFPYCDLSISRYQYYAVSVSTLIPDFHSEILLIGNDDATSITVTPSVNVSMPLDAQDPNSPIITVVSGTPHTITLNELDTLLIQAINSFADLTGTKVVSDKPLTVISGHECGNVPDFLPFCEHISVQIPPTVTWGQRFLLTPFANRSIGQYYKMVAARRNVIVKQSCTTDGDIILEHAGDSATLYTSSITYCYVESNKPILLTQLAPGGFLDTGDPVIAIVSPLEQYSTEVTFEVPDIFTTIVPNINIMAVDEPDVIYLDGSNITSSVIWNTIRDTNDSIVGYGAQITNISTGTHTISTSGEIDITVMVYGFSPSNIGFSYTAGMTLKPLVESKLYLYKLYSIHCVLCICSYL